MHDKLFLSNSAPAREQSTPQVLNLDSSQSFKENGCKREAIQRRKCLTSQVFASEEALGQKRMYTAARQAEDGASVTQVGDILYSNAELAPTI